jgi:transcriptional regulator with XRE-family HTH domain
MAGTVTLTFGQRLRYAREQAGLKQSDLAEMLGIARSTIANWENDDHLPAPIYRREIARIVDVETDFLDTGIQTFTRAHTDRYQRHTLLKSGHPGRFLRLGNRLFSHPTGCRMVPA